MDTVLEVRREKERLQSAECMPGLIDGLDEGALANAAASIVCEQHGYGVGTILWPHELVLLPAKDWRAAMLQAAALILVEVERQDAKAKQNAA